MCCRLDRYEALALRLDLRGALCLRPLDRERIEDYLKQGGDHLQALRDALRGDPVLLDLARSPLMLDLMTRVWTEESTPALRAGGSHHASHLNLLVPVGGGFVFVNGPLLEHFAAMDATTSDHGPDASETANAG